ncbi:MAG TPA: glycosyltransferase family 4 protein [Candidatus Saccharimonadales bacterium]|nr:glycosyltransferase family 4 protein [Candidatus Saccharimonadales bacterium]
MKIALVCPFNMLDRPGGVPLFVHNLAEGLRKRGHTVKIITQRTGSFKGEPPKGYILLGSTMTFKTSGFGTEGNWGKPADSDEIARVLKEENFDVINFHEPWMPMLAWQMVKHSKSAHVGTFHANLMDTAAGKVWTNKLFTPYGRPLLRKMDIFTATSPVAAGMLIKRADFDSAHERWMIENIRYIPLGVDLGFYKPIKKRQPLSGPGTKTIVYIGRQEKRKGVNYLLEAFGLIEKESPDTHLIMGGAGIMTKKLKQYAQTEGLKNVTFTGYLSEAEKLRLIQNADVACYPSPYGEGFGIVLLEAMAVGAPIIAGNNIGYSQVMKGHGRLGLVDPTAIKDFANRLTVFLEDAEVRRSMSSWALNEIKKYDYPRVVQEYEKVYRDAIELKQNGHKAKIAAIDNEKSRKFIRRLLVRRHA